jgi:Flp pilus assembly protein TadD
MSAVATRADVSPPAETLGANELRRWVIPLLLIVAALVAWQGSFGGVFLLDDQPRIVENPQIRQLLPLASVMAESSRPFLQVTLAVNYALGGVDPWGYHAFNLAVHVAAGLVLYGFVRRTFASERLRDRYGKAAAWLAMAIAAIWLVHPLQTQAVTYVIQRAESLMGLFYLLTLYCGARACDSPRARAWGGAAVATCALGMGTKEVMVTAPLVMLLYDRTFVARSFAGALRARWSLYAALAATWLVLAAVLALNRFEEQTQLVDILEPWRYLLTQTEVIVHYLRLAVWPHPLVIDYAWPPADSIAAALPSTFIVLGLVAATILALARSWWPGFWGAWFFLILAPTSSIMPIADIAFEHRMYLPLAAVVVLLVVAAHEVFRILGGRSTGAARARPWLEASVLAAVVVALGVTTARRNDDYRTAVAMWTDAVAKRPGNPRAHNNLGAALVRAGETEQAMARYAEAVRLKPDYVDARNNLGTLLFRKGRIDEAIAEFSEAVRIRPVYADAHGNLGIAFARAGRNGEAVEHLTRAVELNPRSARLRNELANVLYGAQRYNDALIQYRAAVRLQPQFPEAHHNLGLTLLEQGDVVGAAAEFAEAVRLKPDYVKARNNLGIVLYRQGRRDQAIVQFTEALRFDPASIEARRGLEVARGYGPTPR